MVYKNLSYILVSRRYFAASNSKKQVELICNLILPQTEPNQLHELLSKAEATHPLKLHLGILETNLETTSLLYFKY